MVRPVDVHHSSLCLLLPIVLMVESGSIAVALILLFQLPVKDGIHLTLLFDVDVMPVESILVSVGISPLDPPRRVVPRTLLIRLDVLII